MTSVEENHQAEVERALSRMTRQQLVVVAELAGLPDTRIYTDFQGPYEKGVLVSNIIEYEMDRYRKRWQ